MSLVNARTSFIQSQAVMGSSPQALPRDQQVWWNLNAGLVQLVSALESELRDIKSQLQRIESQRP